MSESLHLTFEDAMKELELIVRRLESGEVALEESISAYERGIQLKNHCEKILAEAQLKIEKISLDPVGNISTSTLTKDDF